MAGITVRVSVVICTYTEDLYPHLKEAAESVLAQTYDDVEVVLVSDGSEAVYEAMQADYGEHEEVVVTRTEENVGLSGARNAAIGVASGAILAFMDDDAIAEEDWIAELIVAYEEHDAIAAGGPMTPIWVDGRPRFLPEEFSWLVGVTYPGFAEPFEEVRNTFGSNISFNREVFDELGGFESRVGRQGELNLQAHETEFCARMREEFGRGVVYNPEAKVGHKVFAYRTRFRWQLNRCFWQGYSKRVMERIVPDSSGEESAFLKDLVLTRVPGRIKSLVFGPSIDKVLQLVTLVVFTATVGCGYLYGLVRVR